MSRFAQQQGDDLDTVEVKPRKPLTENEYTGGPLANQRHERFAQEVARGKPAGAAYRAAGYTADDKSAETNGPRLLRTAQIKARVAELHAEVAKAIIMDRTEVLQQLSHLGRANMRDYFTPGPDGEPFLDFSNLTREQAACLQEITVEEFKDGRSDKREVRRVKFKLADKRAALELLAKHHGLLTEQVEHKHTHEHTILGVLLSEIDQESRGMKTIEGNVSQE